MPLKVTLAVGKGKTVELDLANKNATLGDLKEAFSKKVRRLAPSRQSYKLDTTRLDDDSKALLDSGYKEGLTLAFRDLGPQIGYRTVFVIEYLGPILIMLLYYSRPSLIYGTPPSVAGPKRGSPRVPGAWPAYSPEALLGVGCWVAHFLKREFETFFVHKFSRPTMPLSQLWVNCAYYYCFALAIGYFLCSPSYVPPTEALLVRLGLVVFGVSELGNLVCHVMLSRLRPVEGGEKGKARPIPTGFLFELVSCPNYFCEVMSWVGFSLMTNILLSYVFTVVGGVQMLEWAKGKHRGYLKQNGDAYKKLGRKAMIPFVV